MLTICKPINSIVLREKCLLNFVNKVSKFGPRRSIIIKFLSENDKNK